MRLEDDSDMKIVGDDLEPVTDRRQAPPDETAHLLEAQKENGNLSRARRLGAILADEVSAVEGEACTEEAALLTQRRILLAFVVEAELDRLLPNNLVAQTAQNVFYQSLRMTAPQFYEDLQASGAFSFYYLGVREGGSADAVAHRVGETFATLCGRKGDADYRERGQALYARFAAQVRTLCETLDFVPQDTPQPALQK